ncbi:hypothetical protein MG293_019649 [Ovis ammon polii]|uniref:Uncharacterized protein n=1 Tax=Ovis ammon polii TaxID=230172 RepID=A0AAD4TL63_OVIAM|nr:hypothetical protein MG293_019649 [Ovis ammon polii]
MHDLTQQDIRRTLSFSEVPSSSLRIFFPAPYSINEPLLTAQTPASATDLEKHLETKQTRKVYIMFSPSCIAPSCLGARKETKEDAKNQRDMLGRQRKKKEREEQREEVKWGEDLCVVSNEFNGDENFTRVRYKSEICIQLELFMD